MSIRLHRWILKEQLSRKVIQFKYVGCGIKANTDLHYGVYSTNFGMLLKVVYSANNISNTVT